MTPHQGHTTGQLDSRARSYLDSVPALPPGAAGEHALAQRFLHLYAVQPPKIFCALGSPPQPLCLTARAVSPATQVYGDDPHGQALNARFPAEDRQSFFLWIDLQHAVLDRAQPVLTRTRALLVKTAGERPMAEVFATLIERGFMPLVRTQAVGEAPCSALFVCPELTEHSKPAQLMHPANTLPVLIPAFNNPTYCQRMVAQLSERGFSDLRILDNASTSEAMHHWLDRVAESCTVVRLNANDGPRKALLQYLEQAQLPRHVIATDPDIELGITTPTDFVAQLIALAEHAQLGKVGLALNIAERHLFRQEAFDCDGEFCQIWDWEERFWDHLIGRTAAGNGLYLGSIDTTFALYDRQYFQPDNFLFALRVGGEFTARHDPWYQQTRVPPDEQQLYAQTQHFSYYAG